MAEIQRRVIAEDPIVRSQGRKNGYIAAGIAVLAVAAITGALLIPRNTSERNVTVAQVTPQASGDAGRGQVLAGPHGTTFIIGQPNAKMIGHDVPIMDIVNATNKDAFPDLILVRGVEVQTVPGDQVFAIGLTPANSILVKIEEPTEPGHLGENALVIRRGQKVAVSGVVDNIRSMGELKSVFGVNNYEAGQLGNTKLVIRAKSVQILEK